MRQSCLFAYRNPLTFSGALFHVKVNKSTAIIFAMNVFPSFVLLLLLGLLLCRRWLQMLSAFPHRAIMWLIRLYV
jgi:hypothetical protein